MQKQADRMPPRDVDAEMAMLGGVLLSGDGTEYAWDLGELQSIAPVESLFNDRHRQIYKAALELRESGVPLDLVTVQAHLSQTGKLESVGGIPYLMLLAESVPSIVNAPFYARAVRRCWQLRELIRAAGEFADAAHAPGAEPSELIGAYAGRLETIDAATAVDREPIQESELLRMFPNPASNTTGKVPIAIGQLGAILDGGLEHGSLTIIGARPSCGKTSLGLGLCVHASRATGGCPSLFASVEMSAGQVALRLLSMRSGIPVRRIRTGAVADDEFNGARNKASEAAKAGQPVFVLDGTRDVRAIAAHVRRLARREKVRLVVVDYLGLCSITGAYERHDLRIGAMSALFKSLAQDAGVAVVVLEQLNRASDRENRRPKMSDLRDSGKLEADADTVLLLYPHGCEADTVCDTSIIVAKQRQGQCGVAEVVYHKPTMTYQAKHRGAEPSLIAAAPDPVGWAR